MKKATFSMGKMATSNYIKTGKVKHRIANDICQQGIENIQACQTFLYGAPVLYAYGEQQQKNEVDKAFPAFPYEKIDEILLNYCASSPKALLSGEGSSFGIQKLYAGFYQMMEACSDEDIQIIETFCSERFKLTAAIEPFFTPAARLQYVLTNLRIFGKKIPCIPSYHFERTKLENVPIIMEEILPTSENLEISPHYLYGLTDCCFFFDAFHADRIFDFYTLLSTVEKSALSAFVHELLQKEKKESF